jgi:hypothetical protein
MSHVLNGPMQSFFSILQCTSDIIVFPYCMNSIISTYLLSKKTAAISFPADVCLTFLACCVNVCVSTALIASWFQIYKCNPGFITYYSYDVTEKFRAIFMVSLYKS